MMGLLVENNTDKPIYISRNFCLGCIQELIYPNIEQLHSQKAALAKQISYNQHKKAWLKKLLVHAMPYIRSNKKKKKFFYQQLLK